VALRQYGPSVAKIFLKVALDEDSSAGLNRTQDFPICQQDHIDASFPLKV